MSEINYLGLMGITAFIPRTGNKLVQYPFNFGEDVGYVILEDHELLNQPDSKLARLLKSILLGLGFTYDPKRCMPFIEASVEPSAKWVILMGKMAKKMLHYYPESLLLECSHPLELLSNPLEKKRIWNRFCELKIVD